jgi:hypothetical protein
MKLAGLAHAADQYHVQYGDGYGLSLWSWPGCDANEIARRAAGRRLPHPVIRAATAGELCDAGWTLHRSGGQGHVTLWRSERPTEADWQELDKIFGVPEPNPSARPAGGGS